MMMYKGYVQANKRRILCIEDLVLDSAIDFLAETKDGVIYDTNNNKLTKEELENVKSLRSLPGIGLDSLASSGRKVHEDTSGELSGSTWGDTESGTECDNKWD